MYHNYRVNYVCITFDGAQILPGSFIRPPTHSTQILFCLSSVLSCLPPHTPFSQYVAHSCFSLKTVLLINWWVCTCNKSHDSRWTIHLLQWNVSDTESTLGLTARLHLPRGPCNFWTILSPLTDFDFGLWITSFSDIFWFSAFVAKGNRRKKNIRD